MVAIMMNRLAMLSLQTTVCCMAFKGLNANATRVIATLINVWWCNSEFFAVAYPVLIVASINNDGVKRKSLDRVIPARVIASVLHCVA